MDQLATKSGWTGILFLVHENPESRSGQKRIFQHSYSTKGAGRRMEEAMRFKVFKAMKSFLHGKNSVPSTATPQKSEHHIGEAITLVLNSRKFLLIRIFTRYPVSTKLKTKLTYIS